MGKRGKSAMSCVMCIENCEKNLNIIRNTNSGDFSMTNETGEDKAENEKSIGYR